MSQASSRSIKDTTINIRVAHQQRDLIDRAAQTLGKDRSDFMLEVACREAESILLDRCFFQLDEATYQRFIDLLEAPVQSNQNLKRLLQTQAPWETE